MLPADRRLRNAAEFSAVLRGRGRGRSAGTFLVVHVATAQHIADALPGDQSEQVRVGFVVSKAVGNAVTRNRVKRRLRHAVANCTADIPPGYGVVVRALPAAAQADYSQLADEFRRDLIHALGRVR